MRNEFWIISTLISIGVIGGFIFNWPRNTSHKPVDNQQPINVAVPGENAGYDDFEPDADPDDDGDLQRLIQKGDNYLLVGNVQNALTYYRWVYKHREHDASIACRIGLAHELSGELRYAGYYYQRAARDAGTDANIRLTAILGQARRAGRIGRFREALELLCENYLTRLDDVEIPEGLKLQVGVELAQILQQQSVTQFESELTILERPIMANCHLDVPETIANLGKPGSQQTGQNPPNESEDTSQQTTIEQGGQASGISGKISLIQRPSDDVNLMVVAGHTSTLSINELLAEIASVAKMKIDVSANVKPYLVGRSVKLRSESLSLPLLLDCVTLPLGLAWSQQDAEIVLSPDKSLDSNIRVQRYMKQAIRFTRQIIVTYPDRPCVDSMRLSAANLYFFLNQFDLAATLLDQLRDERPVGELNAGVRLSLGMLDRRFLRYDSAIKHFMAAVDQAKDNRVRSIAYANIGRINLAQTNMEPAVIASSRSLALTADDDIRSQAALDLARAYLFTNNPLSANQTLFDHASSFTDGSEQSLSHVYGAYARSLGTLNPISRKKAFQTLAIALAGVDEKQIPFTVDRVLVAKAFLRVGLTSRAVNVLETAGSQQENNIWKRRRQFELGKLLDANGNVERAADIWTELSTSLVDDIGKNATLELARVKLHDFKDADECLRLCERMWSVELTDKMKVRTLKLMGHAYQAQGNVNLAAYCFLGMLPEQNKGNSELQ